MNKIALFFIVALVFGGCSIKDIGKPVVKYSISSADNRPTGARTGKILKISQFKTPAYLLGSKIWYKRKTLSTNSYLYSSWNQDFSTMIESAMSDALYKSGLFKSVFNRYSKSKNDYTLEGEVVRAVQKVMKNRAEVIFEIRLYLIDSKTSKLISSRDFLYRKKCKSVDAQGAVKAYNSIIKTFSKEVILWLKKLVKED